MTIIEAFGFVVRSHRSNLHMSQEAFALSIGMDRSYYSTIEKGKKNVSLKKITQIAQGLNVPLGTIFAEIDQLMSEDM